MLLEMVCRGSIQSSDRWREKEKEMADDAMVLLDVSLRALKEPADCREPRSGPAIRRAGEPVLSPRKTCDARQAQRSR
jgi:hypothetical protein